MRIMVILLVMLVVLGCTLLTTGQGEVFPWDATNTVIAATLTADAPYRMTPPAIRTELARPTILFEPDRTVTFIPPEPTPEMLPFESRMVRILLQLLAILD